MKKKSGKEKIQVTIIEVSRSLGPRGYFSWKAHPAGKPLLAVTGKTQAEAVGRLAIAKARHLNIQIKRLADE